MSLMAAGSTSRPDTLKQTDQPHLTTDNHVALLGEGGATLADGVVESIKAVEIGVDERLVDKLPKMLGRLKLGAMGRLKDETKAVGNSQVFGSMPAGVVELKHDALCGAGPDRFGEVGENEREHLFGDRVGEAPHSSTRFGLDKARHIEPFEPMMAEGDRPLADRRPDSARDRLQAKAMFVHRPELDFGIRVFALLVGGRRLELFLSASRSSSSAVSG